MLVHQITAIIDRYGMYTNKLSQYRQDLKDYRLSNALMTGDDENTLALQLKIAETKAELGQYLNEEV